MSLKAVTDAGQIRRHYDQMVSAWLTGSRTLRRRVGWQGGGGEYDLHWRPKQHVWGLFSEEQVKNRYWCCFGMTDPTDRPMVGITVEINPPFRGIDRHIAGLFATDANDIAYLAHSGKVGGGRKGVSKAGFRRCYRGRNIEEIEWPDGRSTTAIVIGRIDSPRLPAQITAFADEVSRYKSLVARGQMDGPYSPEMSFSSEFSGTKSIPELAGVEARCDHGLVVAALAAQLEADGFSVGNDQLRDLFVVDKRGRVSHLFEVKTDASTTQIYTGVGQLMIHGAKEPRPPVRALVLPAELTTETSQLLDRLGIRSLTYTWAERGPLFTDLSTTLGAGSRDTSA